MHYSRVNIFVKSLRDNSDAISLHNKDKRDQLKSDNLKSNAFKATYGETTHELNMAK